MAIASRQRHAIVVEVLCAPALVKGGEIASQGIYPCPGLASAARRAALALSIAYNVQCSFTVCGVQSFGLVDCQYFEQALIDKLLGTHTVSSVRNMQPAGSNIR